MQETEAISGIFLNDKSQVLLLRRNLKRTYSPGKWDLMGGDIHPGEIPPETLIRDATDKLNIDLHIIKYEGVILIKEGVTNPIRRHLFTCRGDYSKLTPDPKKYNEFGWYIDREVLKLDLCPGVLDALRTVRFIKKFHPHT